MHLYKHHYAEFLCFLIAILCFKKIRGSAFIWFIPFLFLTFITEVIATYVAHVKNLANYPIYNFLTTISFVFYLWFIIRNIENKWIYKSFFPVSIILVLAILVNIFFLNRNTFHLQTYILGCLIIIFYCFFYLYEIIKKYDINFQIEKQPVFWIIIGLLFFYLSGAGFFIFINSFSKELKEQFNEIIRWLSVFMYGCFSIAFILCPNLKMKY